MGGTVHNKRIIVLSSFLWVLFLLFCLNAINFREKCGDGFPRHTFPSEISVLKGGAAVTPGIPINPVHRIWIPNKDSFRLLSFDRISILDNHITEKRMLCLDRMRSEFSGISIPLIHNRTCSSESDGIPILS